MDTQSLRYLAVEMRLAPFLVRERIKDIELGWRRLCQLERIPLKGLRFALDDLMAAYKELRQRVFLAFLRYEGNETATSSCRK